MIIKPRLFTTLILSPFHVVFPKIVVSAAYEQNTHTDFRLDAHAEISIKDTLKSFKRREIPIFFAKFRDLDNHMERAPDEKCLVIF